MKRNSHFLSVALFVVVFAVIIQGLTKLFEDKQSVVKYADLKEDEHYDVLFFGTSHMINAVYPMELWKDYGIVSYNCAGHGNRFPTTYWMMENVLDHCTTDLVVIDVLGLGLNEKIRPDQPGIDQQHISFDWLPLSVNKIKMACYLFDDWTTRMEFIFPISKYHERWQSLGEKDFSPKIDPGKGAEYRVSRVVPDDFSLIDRADMYREETLAKEYLRKMIESCQGRGIEVLLVNVPFPASVDEQKWGNSAQMIAEEYGIDYLNLFYEDTGIDFMTDCFDSNSHLNPSGARKVTKFLGQYLQENCAVPDERDNGRYAHWNVDYEEYAAYKWDCLRAMKEQVQKMMLLSDEGLDVLLFVNGSSDYLHWGTPPYMIHNIAGSKRYSEAQNMNASYFMIADRETGCTEYLGDAAGKEWETSFGRIRYGYSSKTGEGYLYVGENETNYLLDENGAVPNLVTAAFDRRTGELVDLFTFTYQ